MTTTANYVQTSGETFPLDTDVKKLAYLNWTWNDYPENRDLEFYFTAYNTLYDLANSDFDSYVAFLDDLRSL